MQWHRFWMKKFDSYVDIPVIEFCFFLIKSFDIKFIELILFDFINQWISDSFFWNVSFLDIRLRSLGPMRSQWKIRRSKSQHSPRSITYHKSCLDKKLTLQPFVEHTRKVVSSDSIHVRVSMEIWLISWKKVLFATVCEPKCNNVLFVEWLRIAEFAV